MLVFVERYFALQKPEAFNLRYINKIQVIAADKYLIYNGFDGGLTQWLECYFHIVEVVGSNPISPTII